jgi:hypothetical protein
VNPGSTIIHRSIYGSIAAWNGLGCVLLPGVGSVLPTRLRRRVTEYGIAEVESLGLHREIGVEVLEVREWPCSLTGFRFGA